MDANDDIDDDINPCEAVDESIVWLKNINKRTVQEDWNLSSIILEELTFWIFLYHDT